MGANDLRGRGIHGIPFGEGADQRAIGMDEAPVHPPGCLCQNEPDGRKAVTVG